MTTIIPSWTLGDRMRRAMRFAEISTADMAEYLDVQPTTVSAWVGGRINPRLSMVRLVAMRCGVPFEWLRDGGEEPVAMMQARVIAHMSERFPELRPEFDAYADELGVTSMLSRLDSNQQPSD